MNIPVVLISCAIATELISQSLDKSRSLRKQLLLQLHLVFCRVCARFKRQLVMLRRLVRLRARLEGPEGSECSMGD
jgi:hypothetical protein